MSTPKPQRKWRLGKWTLHTGPKSKLERVKVLNRSVTCDWMPSPITGKPIRCISTMEAVNRLVIQWGRPPKVQVPYMRSRSLRIGPLYLLWSTHYGCVKRVPAKPIEGYVR